MKCDSTTEWVDTSGMNQYSPCEHEAKYSIRVKDGRNGQFLNRKVCGIHLNEYKAYEKRLKKRDYDVQLTIEKISSQ